MRILFINNLYPPYQIGGYERQVEYTARGLRESGHEVYVLTGRGRFGDPRVLPLLDLNLEEYLLLFRDGKRMSYPEKFRSFVFNRKNFMQIIETARLLKPNLIAGWNFSHLSPSALAAMARTGIPSVLHVTDDWFLDMKHAPTLSIFEKTVAWKAFRFSFLRKIIVPTERMKEEHVAAGLSSDRLEVIPHGIELPGEVQRAPSRDDRVRFLFACGQLWEGKGLQEALEALGIARSSGFDRFSLSVYGEGKMPYINQLKALARRLGLSSQISFFKAVSRDQLPQVFAAHDVFLFPSTPWGRWSEPFSLVLLEAMASGLPVAAFACGGTVEVIENGRTGFLAPPGNKEVYASILERLGRNELLRQKIGEAGAIQVKSRFGLNPYLSRLMDAYQQAVKTPDARCPE